MFRDHVQSLSPFHLSNPVYFGGLTLFKRSLFMDFSFLGGYLASIFIPLSFFVERFGLKGRRQGWSRGSGHYGNLKSGTPNI